MDYPSPEPYSEDASNADAIQARVANIMAVGRVYQAQLSELNPEDLALTGRDQQVRVSFAGTLTGDSRAAYQTLDEALAEIDCFALLRDNTGDDAEQHPHLVHVVEGRYTPPAPYPLWVNFALLIATVFSVLMVGLTIAVGQIAQTDPALADRIALGGLNELWRGLPYAFSIMLILGAHEMAHYAMIRRHGIAGTLPYFIPAFMISPFGTFGAAIMLRGPIRDRRALFDLGASGPLAGLFFAVPILIIGLATSSIITVSPGGYVEGNSILYAMSKLAVFGEMLPNGQHDVLVNQLAWAGWTGLFVTALNLIPLGQLDGGHVLYALAGDWARRLYWPLMAVGLLLMLFVSTVWMLLFAMLFLFGRHYAVPLDNVTRLDERRANLAGLVLMAFVLIFVPVPLSQTGMRSGLLAGVSPLELGVMTVTALVMTGRWWAWRSFGR